MEISKEQAFSALCWLRQRIGAAHGENKAADTLRTYINEREDHIAELEQEARMDRVLASSNEKLAATLLDQSSGAQDWRHAANEWADMATSGLQWLRNIAAGTSTADEAIQNMEALLAHCKSVSDAVPFGAQGEMVEVAGRNLRSYLSKASFAMEVDRQAAINCLDVLRSAAQQPEFGAPYQGAREDLAIWKRRALEAEQKARHQDQIIYRLTAAMNDINGPTHMGDPVIAEQPAVPEGWQPTPESINALPEPVRRYIHGLQSNADPAGTVASDAIRADQVRELGAALRIERDRLAEVAGCFDAALDEGWIAELNATGSDALHDLWHRRISYAYAVARQSRLSAQQPAQDARWPRVLGVSRVLDNGQSVLVSFADVPTDDHLRALHDSLRAQATDGEGQ